MHFLKNAVRDRKVGAVARSSRYVVKNVLDRIAEPLHVVIEYGPGDGVMTREILKKLSSESRFFVVESNLSFVGTLRQIKDERLQVIEGEVQHLSSENMEKFSGADLVLSSIPFSMLKPADRLKVVSEVHKLLRPGGRFIVFNQYSYLMLKPLKKSFHMVSTSFEPRNIPPCFIFEAKK